jgi:hypothetical protein
MLSDKLVRVWKPEFISTIFPIIPVVLRPLRVGAPGSYPAGPPFSPTLLATSQKGGHLKYDNINPQEDHIIRNDLSEARTSVYIFRMERGGGVIQ